MQRGKRFALLLCMVLLLIGMLPAIPSGAASGPSLVTTLTDHIIQRGSKKTFDVWARNAGGAKIRATVRHNGQRLEPTWDDDEKASYTLHFTQEGENVVTVSASSDGGRKKELTYHITYVRAEAGEEIGRAVWSVEAFTIGCGYLIEPTEVPVYEGETSAEQLLRLLSENGFVGYYGGTVKSSFYLAYIADGTAAGERYNNYQRSQSPAVPRELKLAPSIPALLIPHLEAGMTFFDPYDYEKNWTGYLGEFVFTNGSGWMYTVNNVFPNVGFADCYLSDGDIVRVQFTLGYGADIGGAAAVGTDIPGAGEQPAGGYFSVADKDRLSSAICRARASGLMMRSNVKAAYQAACGVMATLNAAQDAADAAAEALYAALEAPLEDAETAESGKPDSSDTKPVETKPVETKPGETEREESAVSAESAAPDTAADPGTDSLPETDTGSGADAPALSQQTETGESSVGTDVTAGRADTSGAFLYAAAGAAAAAGVILVIFRSRKRTEGADRHV